jgi:hypothetical protein
VIADRYVALGFNILGVRDKDYNSVIPILIIRMGRTWAGQAPRNCLPLDRELLPFRVLLPAVYV